MEVWLVVIAKRGNPVINKMITLLLDYFVVPLLVMTVNELSLAVVVIASEAWQSSLAFIAEGLDSHGKAVTRNAKLYSFLVIPSL